MNNKFVLVILLFLYSYNADCNSNPEFAIKAAYVEKISKYIEWPKYKEDFTILVVGETPIYRALELISSQLKIKNKKIIVRNIEEVNDIEDCNAIYIPINQKSNYKKIFDKLKNTNSLIIGEDEAISKYGVHINFYFRSNYTIHFEIYPENMKQSGLKPDLYLLEIGKRK